MRSNTQYKEFLNTVDDWEDQYYEENKRVTKPTGVHFRKLNQGYIKEQRKVEENHLPQLLPWLLHNIYFSYDGELHTNNDNEKKTTLFAL